jgi:hypothetical protein
MKIRLQRARRNPQSRRSVGPPVTPQPLDSSALHLWERIAGKPVAAGGTWGGRPWRAWLVHLARLAAWALLVAALPFLALVKVAVVLYTRGYPTGLALAGGVACTTIVVTAYAAWAWHRFTGRVRLALVARRVALPLVVAYSAYALVYLSAGNAKSPQVRAYYASLHPLLRVALSTVILADRDLVVTDLARRPADYQTMGLSANDGSLHYLQRDGYIHAIDLRTAGRGFVRNRLVQAYFWSMGFATLRHVGSADHLHVELPVR